ncbi:MAG: hypothetical protein AAFZ09_20470, partial [Pseudomonadota bacterium]
LRLIDALVNQEPPRSGEAERVLDRVLEVGGEAALSEPRVDISRALIAAGNTCNAFFDDCFGETCAGVERAIRSGEALEYDDVAHVRQHLEGVIGQQVHLVYLANTQRRDLGEAAIDKLCKTCSQHFPSVTVQEAQAVYDGLRRPVLIARIRSDDTDAIVGLAQRMCLVFDERFVGIEVGGRYIRVYADDTG